MKEIHKQLINLLGEGHDLDKEVVLRRGLKSLHAKYGPKGIILQRKVEHEEYTEDVIASYEATIALIWLHLEWLDKEIILLESEDGEEYYEYRSYNSIGAAELAIHNQSVGYNTKRLHYKIIT